MSSEVELLLTSVESNWSIITRLVNNNILQMYNASDKLIYLKVKLIYFTKTSYFSSGESIKLAKTWLMGTTPILKCLIVVL